MSDSRIQQFVPFKKIGTDISTKVANDAINADRLKGTINVETLAATRTLLTTDYIAQWLNPNGVSRDVVLPAEASSTNLLFIILNTADGAGEDLLVKNAAAAVKATLGPGMSGIFSCDGTNWKWENDSGVFYDSVSDRVGIGTTTPASKLHVDGGSIVGDQHSNQMVNLASSQILGLMTDARFLNMLCESPLSDMVTNGGFDADTGWTKGTGWTIAGGVAHHATGTQSEILQVFAGITGKKYRVKYTISNYVSGAIASLLGAGASGYGTWNSGNGTYIETVYCTGQYLQFQGTSTFVGDIDNVSVTPALVDISMKAHDGQYMGTWTAGDRLNKGSGWSLDPDGTTAFINLGDSDDFSFGDGTNDSPVTWFGCIEVVDTTALQVPISKWDETTGAELREWKLQINSDEPIGIVLMDESANVICTRLTNAVLSVGFHTFAITYSGLGGATAANGITIYVDGVAVASTATNNASYVAMENLATPVWIGALEGSGGTPITFMQGDIGHIGIDAVEWSAADAWKHWLTCRGLYNL